MRTSYSCASCARKRKCDLSKPACNRCIKLGIECHWPMHNRRTQSDDRGRGSSKVRLSESGRSARYCAQASVLPRGKSLQLVEDIVLSHNDDFESDLTSVQLQPVLAPSQDDARQSHWNCDMFDTAYQLFSDHSQARRDVPETFDPNDFDISDIIAQMDQGPFSSDSTTGYAMDENFSRKQPEKLSEQDTWIGFDHSDHIVAPQIDTTTQPAGGYKDFWNLQSAAHLPKLSETNSTKMHDMPSSVPQRSVSKREMPRFQVMDSINVARSLETSEDIYISTFFKYFCTQRSFLVGNDFWKAVISSQISSDQGIRNAALSVASMYLSQTRSIGRSDAIRYYSDSLRSIQQSLDRVPANEAGLNEPLVIGITLLMVFELLSGNIKGHHSHLQALMHILRSVGARRCRTGTLRLIFLTISVSAINNATMNEQDIFIADEDWIETLYATLPLRYAAVLSLYAKAARCIALHRMSIRFRIRSRAEMYSANRQTAADVLKGLRLFYRGYEKLGFPSIAHEVDNDQILSSSPFQPSIKVVDLRCTTNFPTLAASILNLEQTFEFQGDPGGTFLARQLVQVAQYVIVTRTESSALLQQLWPLKLVRQYIYDSRELAWIRRLEEMIRMKGFGIATAR